MSPRRLCSIQQHCVQYHSPHAVGEHVCSHSVIPSQELLPEQTAVEPPRQPTTKHVCWPEVSCSHAA